MVEENGKPKRETISVTLLPDNIRYLDDLVASGKYRSRSHVVEEFIARFKEDGINGKEPNQA